MKINDLFIQDLLNPKAIVIKEQGKMIELTKKENLSEVMLIGFMFVLTVIIITNKTKLYAIRKKNQTSL